jgi:hypothetical protein
MQTKELNNGRLAMIAIAAFTAQVRGSHLSALLLHPASQRLPDCHELCSVPPCNCLQLDVVHFL